MIKGGKEIVAEVGAGEEEGVKTGAVTGEVFDVGGLVCIACTVIIFCLSCCCNCRGKEEVAVTLLEILWDVSD